MTPHLEALPPAHVPRDPSQTVLYHIVADHLKTFLASLATDPDARGLPCAAQKTAEVSATHGCSALQALCELLARGPRKEISCGCIWTPPLRDYTPCGVQ
jgi:hypothetical protein